jgi:hypothetical protein
VNGLKHKTMHGTLDYYKTITKQTISLYKISYNTKVKISMGFINDCAMKKYWEGKVYLQAF